HEDFQSSALPTELSGRRGVLKGFSGFSSTLNCKKKFVCCFYILYGLFLSIFLQKQRYFRGGSPLNSGEKLRF
ncbi:hypothetical protein LDJ79_22560, partial [Vibrio tritonius]